MSIDEILVSVAGLGLIGFIWWFFFGKRQAAVNTVGDEVEIIVEGGYKPSVIEIPVDRKTKLTFIRKDPNSCLEEIVIPDFKIKKYLPIGERIVISVTPKKVGEYDIHCGMNMFHGKLLVTKLNI